MLALEAAVSKNESVISDLNSVIQENAIELQCKCDDLEKKSQELSQHKTKSANEVSNYCSIYCLVVNYMIVRLCHRACSYLCQCCLRLNAVAYSTLQYF